MKCLTHSSQAKDPNPKATKRPRIVLRLDRDSIDIALSNRTLLTQDNSSYIFPQKRKRHLKKNSKNNLNDITGNNNLSIQTQKTIPKKTISDTSKDLIIMCKNQMRSRQPNEDCEKQLQMSYASSLSEKCFQCIFCEKNVKKDFNTNKIKCSHKFCYQCGKSYYEGKIEEGYLKELKCCVFDCKYAIDMEILNEILSKNHLEIIREVPQAKQNAVYSSNVDLKDYFDNNKIAIIKEYSLKHLLDVNTNQHFFQYNSSKQMVCPHCNEMALYGKTNHHFVKCFNCFYRLCKHCLLEYTNSHMNLNSEQRCKVYYRRIKSDSQDASLLIRNFCLSVLLLFTGFVLISSIYFVWTKNTLLISNKFKRCFLFGLYLIISIITFPIFLMTLPYYPLLTCICY